MNDLEMKDLLDRIIETKHQLNTFFWEDAKKPTAGEPASPDELMRLDAYLVAKGFTMPPSYRQFLTIYNGIENVFGPKHSLLPARGVVVAKENILGEMAEQFPDCVEFVVGSGDTPEFVGFDVSTSPDGAGYEIIWVSAEATEWRLSNFEEFLGKYLAVLERRLTRQLKDRENLAP